MTKVKICGITDIQSAQTAAAAGADFIGFVFAPSKRKITPEKAAEIGKGIPSTTKKVGVFVNESVEHIKQIAETAGLDYIQLHGDETPDIVAAIPYPVIKAFSIEEVTADMIEEFACTYYLIDSPGEAFRGGSGKTFDWTKLDQLGIDRDRCILAGGLSAGNIQKAIQIACPAGVDVSSGVETAGIKDQHKIKAFIQQVKEF